MTERIRTRRQLVRKLIGSPDRAAALRVVRATRALSDESTAELLLARFNRALRVRRSRAESIAWATAAVARVDGGTVARAIAHRTGGILDHLAGRPRPATRRLRQAADLLRAAERWTDAGDVFRILIDVLMLADDDAGARRAGRDARACYGKAAGTDHRRLGSLAMNLGNLHHRRDEHRQALDAYSLARRHFRRVDEPIRLANVDFNRANILATLDRTIEARRLYEQARGVYQDEKQPGLAARADGALAVIDLREGHFDRCLHRLHAVRDRYDTLGDRLGVAHSDLDMAEALLCLNRPIEARDAAGRADRFFRRAGHVADSAACAGVLGGSALQSGRAADAAKSFSRGASLQRRLRNPVAAALHDTGGARAEIGRRRADKAIRMARGAAAVFARRKLRSREARALSVAAEAALSADRPKLARSMARRSRDLARRWRDRRVELSATIVLAAIEERGGDSQSAYRYLRSAERCVEKLRRGVSSEESHLAFALDKSEVYESLVLNRLRRGDARSIRQALAFAERGKARALAERLAQGRIEWLGAGKLATRRLISRLNEVEQQLALAESRIQDTTTRPGLRNAGRARLRTLTEARSRTLQRLARTDPNRAALVGAAPPDPETTIGRLGPDDVVLEYTAAGGQFHLFVVERDRVTAIPDLAPIDDVRELVERLRFQLGKGVLWDVQPQRYRDLIRATLSDYMKRLHDLLLAPVIELISGRRVRIVPHGVLHGLPFHALESGGVSLVDRCVVSYAPSLAAIELLSGRRAETGAPAVVLGVADSSAPLIESEVDAVRRHVDGALVYRGDRATRNALRLGERRPPLLHVACHGYFSESGPWTGGLRLGDSWLSLPDLYEMQGMADLVVLSGCQTGRGTVYSGDEWVGLVRGFLQAGAQSVVASLWEVQDRATLTLMEAFYEGLATGLPVADALAVAQRRARSEDALPLLWAPFVVIGEPDLRVPLRKVA